MIGFRDGNYYLGVWFVGGKDTDWLGCVWREKDSPHWIFRARFRYHNPESIDPFDGKDKKSHMQFLIDRTQKSEEDIIKDVGLIAGLIGLRFGVEPEFIEIRGDKDQTRNVGRKSTDVRIMTDDLFRTGPWRGFYTYSSPHDKHRMDLALTFTNGVMTGEGNDDLGAFVIQGRYDAISKECHWTKSYVGLPDVFYRGCAEGKGIWGTWEIDDGTTGGFHIWPLGSEGDGEVIKETEEEPIEAVSEPVLVVTQY